MTAAGRFWAKVDTSRGAFACWRWLGAVDAKGYGKFRGPDGRTVLAHRFSLELAGRPLDAGQAACHTCDNPPCVNPAHLFAGTTAENNADMAAKGRARSGGAIGERVGTARLDNASIVALRELAAEGLSQRQLAKRFGVSQSSVWRVLSGSTWGHVG